MVALVVIVALEVRGVTLTNDGGGEDLGTGYEKVEAEKENKGGGGRLLGSRGSNSPPYPHSSENV